MSNYGDDGRDTRGRWRKGHCPNPKGRPRKEPQISDSDVGFFKQSVVEVVINGKQRALTRHELLLHSMFEQAIKGKSAVIARKLLDRFEAVDDTWAQAREWYRENREIFLEKHAKGEFDEKLANDLLEVRDALNYGRDSKKPTRVRRRAKKSDANWRTGSKPQAILDMEAEWAADDEARNAARRKAGK